MPEHLCAHPDDNYVQSAHDFNFLVAQCMAKTNATDFARGLVGRRGTAHQLLVGAHMIELIDGMGEEAAYAFFVHLVEELFAGTDDRRAVRAAEYQSRVARQRKKERDAMTPGLRCATAIRELRERRERHRERDDG